MLSGHIRRIPHGRENNGCDYPRRGETVYNKQCYGGIHGRGIKNCKTMKAIDNFNYLLIRSNAASAITNDTGGVKAVILPKDNGEMFLSSIIEAIESAFDYTDVNILKAEEYDFGYEIELSCRITQDSEERTEIIYLQYASIY